LSIGNSNAKTHFYVISCRYVIKATTYEIGILADVPDNDTTTDNGPVTRQQVDLTFYNTESNGTDVNFGDIPFPVKTTGLKGQVITGIARLIDYMLTVYAKKL
jgi:hypothetical protein